MPLASADRLVHLCDIVPPMLLTMGATNLNAVPADGSWSKKEILGHLVDSAANNHQRFVRVQFEDTPTIFYDADLWNMHNYYLQLDTVQLISFWEQYNRHLAHLATAIPHDMLDRTCNTGGPAPVSLQWLIDDYVTHLEHHLHQVFEDNEQWNTLL